MRIEGVYYEVDWKQFTRGKSLSFPCLDPERARAQLHEVTSRLGIEVHTKIVIEEGVRLLRAWRM